ncbi:hypothetical protein VOLCADRAFT_94437 [Volvox carteri f. nagariensis]|uniref:Uncharacterized protein n=1 Tax=Volvox carteri f. nagariensis TaxID=3068 RepID=D8U4T1_VOLCA|nr:uncharacterized protein VOLCADRAFT_94437 [Volvox carteri f. nagariensis]EFJ45330.1 hypothetical protein VOLCADRAFT_94437 [Volvox carteri f. nagariensis]|eukprot:XP_002953706.1 hypothetical protein VOLCADRAFT_94437 [Volvox carteri f. nagariensis]
MPKRCFKLGMQGQFAGTAMVMHAPQTHHARQRLPCTRSYQLARYGNHYRRDTVCNHDPCEELGFGHLSPVATIHSYDDDFAALVERAVALAEAGDFHQAAQGFRDALAAASRGAATAFGPAPADMIHAVAGSGCSGDPGSSPTTAGAAAQTAADCPLTVEAHACARGLTAAGASAGRVDGGLSSGSGGVGSAPGGRAHGRQKVAEVHDMLAQCLMDIAVTAEVEEGEANEADAMARAGNTEAEAGLAVEQLQMPALAVWEEALYHAAEACRLSPQWVPARLTYGRCLRNCGLLEEALRELNSAVQILEGNRCASGRGEPSASRLAMTVESGAKVAATAAEPYLTPLPGEPSAVRLSCGRYHQHQPVPEALAAREGTLVPYEYGDAGPCTTDSDRDLGLMAEVVEELAEVSELWQQRLARHVGLRGLQVQQNAGLVGEGPGRRVWECGIVLAAYLVRCMAPSRLADLSPVLPAAMACLNSNAALIEAAGGSAEEFMTIPPSVNLYECSLVRFPRQVRLGRRHKVV